MKLGVAVALVVFASSCGGDSGSKGITIALAPPPRLKPVLVIGKTTTERYVVRGSSAQALRAALRAHGPKPGATRWWITWQPVGECPNTGYRVHLELEFVLPRWQRPTTPDRKVEAAWRLFMSKLRHHQNEHRAIAITAATMVHEALNDISPTPCHSLVERARRTAHHIIRRYRRAQRDLDQRTDDGRVQGAYL